VCPISGDLGSDFVDDGHNFGGCCPTTGLAGQDGSVVLPSRRGGGKPAFVTFGDIQSLH
jgi:hypothetical protein